MGVSYRNQVAITDYLIQRLEVNLSGRDQTDCLDRLPHDRYHLGVLAPQYNSGEAISQPAAENEQHTPDTQYAPPVSDEPDQANANPPGDSDDVAEYSPAEIENEDADRLSRENILTRRGAPSALGIEFMVNAQKPFRLEFDVHFAIYTRRFPTWTQFKSFTPTGGGGGTSMGGKSVTIRDRYVRHEIRVASIPVQVPPQTAILSKLENPLKLKIDEILNRERCQPDVWRKIRPMTIPLSAVSSEDTYDHYLANLQQEIDLPPVSVYLDIRTLKMPDGGIRVSAYLVNGTLGDETSIITNTTRYLIDAGFSCTVNADLAPVEMVSAPEDYQYDPYVWVIGQGCSARILNESKPWVITTEALAKFDQYRLTTRNDPPAPFDELMRDPLPLLKIIHKDMNLYAEDWDNKLRLGHLRLDDTQEKACLDDLSKFRDETNRFYLGIEALEYDPRLLEAFKAMHRVFGRVGASRGISSWRLFQLGFIVTQLSALAVREGFETDTLDYADVLWFPTGGGKTEAYLGLICCALLYDRLRGKSNGVTAWLRFPLRMLSVQQLQRAVKVLYEAEIERQRLQGEHTQGSAPFALGYFVGKSSTPNKLSDASWEGQWKLSSLAARQDLRDKIRLIRDCPRCGETAVEVVVDTRKARLYHICQACKLDLNIIVSDDEIYRYLPSVLVGTVDKLPSVAWRREFSHIWGNVDSWCSEHGFASGKYCIVFGCKGKRAPVQLTDPVPSLQIQDELHLLREELGTFAGHYETLATTCQSRVTRPPKILAATATVEGIERQSPHLYNLIPRRFPGRGYQLGKSFYTEYAKENDEHPRIGRRYLAFKPPFLRPPDASADVLEILHSEIRALYRILEQQGTDSLAKTLEIEPVSYDEAIELLDKYDTTLTYVGSKAHGSRIERELTGRSRGLPKAGNRNMEISYLNGESTLDDIASTIDSLESDTEWDDAQRLDAVIGTSLISHGVDVARFNLMVMSGMPGRTAEYIQSSSRSGRAYVGIVIVVLSPWLLREQSVYHRFETYHYHMEHLVEPVPINRFSRFAVDKTLPGLLAGVLNAYFSPQLREDLSRTLDVQKVIYQDASLTEEQILSIVRQAFAVDSPLYTESLRLSLDARIQQRFKSEIRRLSQPGAAKRVTDALSRKPMSSLRDVDAPVPFDPKEYSYSKLRWL